jgi:hypothetical protein
MAKLSKAERAEVEKNLSVCRAACVTFEKILKEDDEAASKSAAASDNAVFKGIAARDGNSAAFLAIRLAGGNSIADAVHGRTRREE